MERGERKGRRKSDERLIGGGGLAIRGRVAFIAFRLVTKAGGEKKRSGILLCAGVSLLRAERKKRRASLIDSCCSPAGLLTPSKREKEKRNGVSATPKSTPNQSSA